MTLNITQDNTRTELLGSSGALIIHKLYELASDPNNTVTLSGSINSTSAYEDDVTYLNTTYSPNLTVNATTQYVAFEEPNAAKVCAVFFGDGVGVTKTQMANADFSVNNKHDITVNGESLTNVTYAEAFSKAGVVNFTEFRYFTGITKLGGSLGELNSTYSIPLYGLKNNSTIEKITLPPNCTEIQMVINMIGSSHEITITNIENIRKVNNYLGYFSNNSYNFKNIDANFSNNGYSQTCMTWATTDVIKMPESSVHNWSSSENVLAKTVYATKIIFPSTFQCNSVEFNSWQNNEAGSDVRGKNRLKDVVFLSLILPFTTISTWALWTGFKIYIPDSSTYANVSDSGTLSQFANLATGNKELLEEYGCTVTGTFGSYVVKAPNEP